MRPLPLKLGPGSDLRRSLEQLAIEQGASGFVLGVVGNLSRATFQCAGRSGPTVLEGDLEIITLQGTVAPQGVHLHLSLSDGDCQVWGGHLEPGTLVLKGADLLVGFLPSALPANVTPRAEAHGPSQHAAQRRVEVAVLSGCPWSKRALRMLRTLGIPHQVQTIATDAERRQLEQRSGQSTLPQVFIDGQLIGGYDDLAELQGRGGLDRLRSS
jgi:predicted DNA-binding protein with PD1-like motif/glutaredoxin